MKLKYLLVIGLNRLKFVQISLFTSVYQLNLSLTITKIVYSQIVKLVYIFVAFYSLIIIN